MSGRTNFTWRSAAPPEDRSGRQLRACHCEPRQPLPQVPCGPCATVATHQCEPRVGRFRVLSWSSLAHLVVAAGRSLGLEARSYCGAVRTPIVVVVVGSVSGVGSVHVGSPPLFFFLPSCSSSLLVVSVRVGSHGPGDAGRREVINQTARTNTQAATTKTTQKGTTRQTHSESMGRGDAAHQDGGDTSKGVILCL